MVLVLLSPQISFHFLNIDLYLHLVCGADAVQMTFCAVLKTRFVGACSWGSIWLSISASGKGVIVCWCLADGGVDSL